MRSFVCNKIVLHEKEKKTKKNKETKEKKECQNLPHKSQKIYFQNFKWNEMKFFLNCKSCLQLPRNWLNFITIFRWFLMTRCCWKLRFSLKTSLFEYEVLNLIFMVGCLELRGSVDLYKDLIVIWDTHGSPGFYIAFHFQFLFKI